MGAGGERTHTDEVPARPLADVQTLSLFGPEAPRAFGPGAVLLRGFATPTSDALMDAVEAVAAAAPPRRMSTPGGKPMSAAITCCGAVGWVTDRKGYRYTDRDPSSGRPWPPMPASFADVASRAAAHAGYVDFTPDACLVNHYAPGARMTLHRDEDEEDLDQPIVSISLGLPATFLFGGPTRRDRAVRLLLTHGDVVVWGGPSRLFYHGVLPVPEGRHPRLGPLRVNLTFRKAR